MIDVFLVNDDVDRSSVIRAAVAANTELSLVSETQNGREGLFALATIMQGHPRVAIVRLNLGDMSGFDLIAQIKQKSPDVYVVPMLEGNEGGQVWQSLLQLELRDVIVGPIPQGEIAKILNSAAPRAQERFDVTRPTSQTIGEAFVVAVVSARGGIGKSVIAVNLASSMAKLSNSVSLLDFSLNPGDFAVMLDDVPRNNIMDAVAAGGNMDSELLQNLLAPHPRLGFRYLACPNQEFDPTAFDYNISLAMVNAMRNISEFIIVDTGLPFNGPTLAAASSSDIVFFVTSRDVARLLAAQRMVKYLKNDLNLAPQKLKVLVNQAEIGTEISESEIESLLEHPVTAYLPSNPAPVAYSINSGAPFVIAEPQHPVSVVLNKLGELTHNRWQDRPTETAERGKTKALKGMVSKIAQK
jgi:MinD-like ATPase involved in chromosome partitioning or flagellar assembly/CheY-like chemotaxis protein